MDRTGPHRVPRGRQDIGDQGQYAEHSLVGQGYGSKEKESYADLRRVLAFKNIKAARADLS
jgi:hypothetical protein